MKRLTLIIATATVLVAGFGVAVYAYDVPDYSRNFHYGYFTNQKDDNGDFVLQNNANDGYTHYNTSTGGYDAIPPSVNTVDELIDFIKGKLSSTRVDLTTLNNATNWDRTGGAFIVQTMIGTSRNRPPTSGPNGEIAEWEKRVRHAASLNHIHWNDDICTGTPNTYYQINRRDGSSYLNDVAWYDAGRCGKAIRFYKDNGQLAYTLYRQCANPVGQLDPLTDDSWSAWGSTLVTDNDGPAAGDTSTEISIQPGAQVTFRHDITNNGPANADIWYATYGRDGTAASVPWTGEYYSNPTLSGAPTFTRNDQNVAFNWGTGGPGGGLPNDSFSVRWTKTENLPAGTYWFTIVGDDGVRLWIDGALKIDAWVVQGATSYTYSTNLAAGNHTLKMEYYENLGGSLARMDYSNKITRSGTDSGWYSAGQTKQGVFTETVNVPSNAPAGTQFCRRILWDWKNSTAVGDWGLGSAGFGYQACATVTGSFTLVPTITPTTSSGGLTVSQGDTVNFDYKVQNTGSINSPTVGCSIAGTQPSGTPAPPATNCPRSFNLGAPVDVTNADESITIGTQPAGSQICRTLTVTPASGSGAPASSPQVCVMVAKKPYVHFKGSDVWAGGGFIKPDGTCSTNTGAKITTVSNQASAAGSVAEYGTFALSDVTKFGSGNKALFDSTNFGDLGRRLVFANNTTNLGRFGAPQHCIKDYIADYQSAPSSPIATVDVGSTCNGTWHMTGDIQIHGLMQRGCKQVYLVDGDVTVIGGPQYVDPGGNPSYTNAGEIPSLVVIASGTMNAAGVVTKGNIYVQAPVSQMSGVYIARNTFYTCYPKPSPPTVNTCNVQLVLNGSVTAGNLDLYRTFGGDGGSVAQRQTPAEIFNLSPEVFLSSALTTSTNQTISTSDSRELPPRF